MVGNSVVPDQYYFNLDGALLSAQADVFDCVTSAMKTHDVASLTQQQFDENYSQYWGLGFTELIREITGCCAEHATIIAREYSSVCEQRGFVKTAASEDLHELLHRLSRNSTQLHCVSSYIPDPETLLYEKNLHRYFRTITNTMNNRTEFWQELLLNADLQKICIVSDRAVDLQYGVAQKIVTVAVTWGADDTWDLGLQTPDVILTNAAESKRFFIDGVLPKG